MRERYDLFCSSVMDIHNFSAFVFRQQRAAAVHRALETCKELLALQRENVRKLWIESIELKQTLRLVSAEH